MQKGFSSVLLLLLSFIMILVLAGGIWYYFQFHATEQQGVVSVEIPSQMRQDEDPTPQITPPQDWEEFTSVKLNLALFHPHDAEIISTPDGVAVTIVGPTQTENTELFDGIALSITTSPLNGRMLEEVAQEQQAQSAVDPVIQNSTPVEQISYGSRQGYSYAVTGLGTREIMFFPLAEDLYLKIDNATVDPTNVGFAQIAEQIVSTIKEAN